MPVYAAPAEYDKIWVQKTRRERAMRAKWPILAVVVIIGAGYISYPYVTLYRLGIAVRTADAATLQSLVDWYSVREGLKEDICDMVLDEPTPRPSNELAPFGASFVRGMTGNALDQRVTPEMFVSMSHVPTDRHETDATVEWAFFQNPTTFSVNLRSPGGAEPIRVEMELLHMRWMVKRVWLPNDMLERAGAGT